MKWEVSRQTLRAAMGFSALPDSSGATARGREGSMDFTELCTELDRSFRLWRISVADTAQCNLFA